MRIRQIRPEFFTDPVTGTMTPPVQMTYIGLWCVADDAGWLTWDVPQLGALLYPYKSVPVRERLFSASATVLVDLGRVVIEPCGCAYLPKLSDHQKIGGNKSTVSLDRHRVHTNMDRSEFSASNVRVGNVTVGNVSRAQARENEPSLKDRVAWGAPDPERLS